MKKLFAMILLTLCCALTVIGSMACTATQTPASQSDPAAQAEDTNPIVQFIFNTGDVITVELYPDQAPITVANFLNYVRDGFYKGTIIHRVESYVVQGGGYVKQNGVRKTLETGAAIKGEFWANGVSNNVSHTAGTISMARTTAYDSATSQFFFCPVDYLQWDGQYAAFGHVTDQASLDAIVRMSKVETDSGNTPVSDLFIRSVVIIRE